jgi:RimJ/RimL family protein N-acetyltransferase
VTRPTLSTERLILRPWQESDLVPFAALNADARVMEYMPARLDRAASDAMVARAQAHFDRHGFGPWAAALRSDETRLIGFVGLMVPSFQAHFTPCVEIGWRLAVAHWGQGFATEAARAALAFGFATAGLGEIVSFTTAGNARSRAVMERLATRRDPADDFDHPALSEGHVLRQHVLYRLARRTWEAAR